MEKDVSYLILALLIANAVTIVGFNIKPAGAWTGGTIYIRADGRIDPPGAPIETFDNVTYVLTDNVTSSGDGIVVERSNIIINGAGFVVQGSGASDSKGINITRRINVTITDINIESFYYAIWVYNSSTIILGNNVTNTQRGIWLVGSTGNVVFGNKIVENIECAVHLEYSWSNNISGNNIIANTYYGISLKGSSGNNISENHLTNNWCGIWLEYSSSGNVISGNKIANNSRGIALDYSPRNNISENLITNSEFGILLTGYSDHLNRIYHNNFVNNTKQASVTVGYVNVWDDGYPSGGNYWSDYPGVDFYSGPYQNETGSDGIGDTPYTIDSYNQDRYPLIYPYGTQTYKLTVTTTIGGTTTPSPGTYTYANGTSVSVAAFPGVNYTFAYWELDGVNVGSENPINVLMTANHTLHAVFLQVFQLTITSTAGGTANPSPGTYNYTVGTELNVTAIPNTGYSFAYWLLDEEVRTENPISILMDANHILEAYFVDDIPPEISEPTQNPPPENVQPNQDVTVTITVTDQGSGVKNVTLWYSIDNGTTWTTLNMTELAANTFQATIPGYGNCTWITYKIVAYDNNENMAVADNNGYNYRYHVIPEFSTNIIIFLMLAMLTSTLTIIIERKLKIEHNSFFPFQNFPPIIRLSVSNV